MKFEDELVLTIGHEIINRESCTTFLGLRIDEFLKWDAHVNFIQKKLSSALYVLRASRKMLSYSNLRILYHALFEPHLKYGMLLWSNTSCGNKNLLFKCQKKALRVITNARYNDHTDSLFKKCKIMKLDDMITMSNLELMYKFVQNVLPPGVSSLFSPNAVIHQYNTRQRNIPHTNAHSTSIFNTSFLNKAPLLYSALNNQIKNKQSLVSFRRSLKKQFIDSY